MSMPKLVVPRRLSLPLVYQLFSRTQSTVPLKQSIDVSSGSNARPFKDIPGPKGVPYIGSIHRFMGRNLYKFHKVNQKMFEEFGPIFKVTLFGDTVVHVVDPEDSQAVYRSEGKYPSRSLIGVSSLALIYKEKNVTSLPISQGEEWKYLRTAIQSKMMRPRQLHDNIDGFNAVVDDTLQSILRARGKGTTEGDVTTLEHELPTWATESIGTLVFDTRIGLYEDPPNEDAQQFIKSVQTLFTCFNNLEYTSEKMFYKMFDTPSMKKLREELDIVRAFARKKLDAKMEELKEDLNNPEKLKEGQAVPLLGYLLAKKELSHEDIINNAIDMFVGGVENVSIMLTWALYRLATHQDVQERLYQEMISAIGKDGYLSAKDLSKIPYMKAFLKEVLRLDGIAPSNVRILDQDITLKGYNVPAGVLVCMDIYATNRCETYIKDGEDFQPERWLKETGDTMHPFTSLPFGFGPRMCIGKRIAELEIISFLSKVVQRFKLEYNHEPVDKICNLVLKNDRKVVINFIDRD